MEIDIALGRAPRLLARPAMPECRSMRPVRSIGRIVLLLAQLAAWGAQATPALARDQWMPDPPFVGQLVWDIEPPSERSCDARIDHRDTALIERLSRHAGLAGVQIEVCSEQYAASSIPPGVLRVAPQILGLPHCQKAFILGHELAHLAMRHSEEEFVATLDLSRARRRTASEALAIESADLAVVLDLGPLLIAQEREADWIGAMLAATEGCNLAASALAFLSQEALHGDGGGIASAHEENLVRIRLLQSMRPMADRLAAQAAMTAPQRPRRRGGELSNP